MVVTGHVIVAVGIIGELGAGWVKIRNTGTGRDRQELQADVLLLTAAFGNIEHRVIAQDGTIYDIREEIPLEIRHGNP